MKTESFNIEIAKKEFKQYEYILYVERYIYVYRPSAGIFIVYNSKSWERQPAQFVRECDVIRFVLTLNKELSSSEFLELFDRIKFLQRYIKEQEGGIKTWTSKYKIKR